MIWYLSIYADDDETVIAECATDPAHVRPFLHVPDRGVESAVDFLKGSSTIGQTNVRVLDKRTDPNDQSTGWFTALLGQASGESARIGRRVRLEQAEGAGGARVVVMDGVIGSATLDPTLVDYTLEVRDIREREREASVFTRTGTSAILPRGVLEGYGQTVGGSYLVPPVVPYRATVVRSYLGEAPFVAFMLPAVDVRRVPLSRVVTEEAQRAVLPAYDATRGVQVVRDVAIYWRAAGTTPWNVIPEPAVLVEAGEGGNTALGLLSMFQGEYRDKTGAAVAVNNLTNITAAVPAVPTEGDPPLPAHGETVEVVLVHIGAPTEDFPFHYEGPAGILLRNLYRGDYSRQSPRVRYNEAACLALFEPVRLRLTESESDLRAWVEKNIYQPLGAAPALDDDGAVSPIRYELPVAGAALVEINDGNTRHEETTWSHSGADAVNRVVLKYVREYRVQPEDDPLGERTAADGILERSISIETESGDSLALLGEETLEMAPVTFRALGTGAGVPLSGDVSDETGYQLGRLRGRQIIDRFRYGGQFVTVRCRASETSGVRVGDWVYLGLSWLPDYTTGRRGCNRYAQVLGARSLNPAWREFKLLDGGPAEAPLAPPVLGALSEDGAGVVTVPITSSPAGGAARVDYALGAVPPALNSGAWVYAGRAEAPGAVQTPPLPSGSQVWVIARSEGDGRRPSSWTAPVAVTVAAVPHILRASVSVDGDTGETVVFWTPNAIAEGVRIFYAAHVPGQEPVLSGYVDRVASAESVLLPLLVPPGTAITAEVEPWDDWTGVAVSGEAGARVRVSVVRAPGDAMAWTYSLWNLHPAAETADTITFAWEQGPNVGEVAVWMQTVTRPGPEPADPIEYGTNVGGVTTERAFTFPRPRAGQETHFALVPYTADARQLGDIVRGEIDAIPPALTAALRVAVTDGLADLTLTVDGSASVFPALAQVFEDDNSVPFASFPVTQSGTFTPTTVPALGGRSLPLREVRRWRAVVTDAAARPWYAVASADRDALPDGTRQSWDDYESHPIGRTLLDDDTDVVEYVTPEGTRTYAGLGGSGEVVFVLGASALDGGGFNAPLAVGETRDGFEVWATGGGVRTLVWSGALHGVSPVQPTTNPRVVPSASLGTAQVYVIVGSPVGENVRLEWQESESAGAPVSVSGYVAPGTEVVIPTVFTLARDQIQRIRVRARGQASGIDSTWQSVTLNPKGTAYLDQVDLYFNATDGKLYLQATGGAFCASARFQVDDDAAFGSPLLDETLALVDGQVLTASTAVLAAAQTGRTWYGRVTPINAGGVASAPVGDAEPVAEALPLILQALLIPRDGGAWVRIRYTGSQAAASVQISGNGTSGWFTDPSYNANTAEGNFAGTRTGEAGSNIALFQPNAYGGASKYVYLRALTAAGEAGPVYKVEIPPKDPVTTPLAPFVTNARAVNTAGNTTCGSIQNTIYVSVSNTTATGYGIVVEEWRTDASDWQAVHAGVLALGVGSVVHTVSNFKVKVTTPAVSDFKTWTYRARVVTVVGGVEGVTASPPVVSGPITKIVEAC